MKKEYTLTIKVNELTINLYQALEAAMPEAAKKTMKEKKFKSVGEMWLLNGIKEFTDYYLGCCNE